MDHKPLGFYERVKLHGLYDVYVTKSRPLKAFWAVAFFAAIVAAIYGCTAIVIEYVKSPIVVTYLVQEPNFMRLPDLVICPFNRLDRVRLREFNVSDEIAQYIEASFSGLEYLDYQRMWNERISNNSKILESQLNAILVRTNLTFEKFFEVLSLRCDSVIESCLNTGRQYDCCNSSASVRTLVGKCFRIRGFNQVVAGFGFGMTVKIVLPLERFQPAYNNFHNFGVMVKLAEEGKGIGYDLEFLPAGSHAILRLRPTKFEFLDDSRGADCFDVDEDSNYSTLRCFENCLGEVGYKACNCQLIAGSAQRNLASCTWHKLKHCFFPALENMTVENVKNCRARCKIPCKFFDFGAGLSYSHFPAPTVERFITNKKKLADLRYTIILDVFYEKLSYTKIKHLKSITFDSFVSKIGKISAK